MRTHFLIPMLSLLAAPLAAQTPSPFRALELPAPNVYRSGSGLPGPQYWQQRVDYKINGSLDAVSNSIRGVESILYHNNSPDTLRYIWLQVEQNICAPSSLTNKLNQPPLVFGPSTF